MQYRKFLSLTDDEIRYIITEMFDFVTIEYIYKNTNNNTISVFISADGWLKEDGTYERVQDKIVLTPTNIHANFAIEENELVKYYQYLFAKGCNKLLRNNPYLT